MHAYYRMAQPLKVTERDHQAKKTSHIVDIVHRLLMGSKVKVTRMATRRRSGLHSTVRSHVFRKLFMESVLLKAKFDKFKHRPILAQFSWRKGDVGP